MRRICTSIGLLALLVAPSVCRAGLYYSGEPMAQLPSQWRGFLLDQRTLRRIAVKPQPGVSINPMREQYLQAVEHLKKTKRSRQLTADELADLGAIQIRLGEIDKAIEVLRKAFRQHPKHFPIVANLGTAWQLQGDLRQAAFSLQQAVRLAPGKLLQGEQYHLKLVQQRLQQPAGSQELDDLFGVQYVGENGRYQVGKIAEREMKKLPSKAVAIVQQLCLWLPADGRLLWQLGEIANAHGDVRNAANMLEGCVVQFGLKNRTLREHRLVLKEAVKNLPPIGIAGKADHETHVGGLRALSKRPLLIKVNQAALPPISATGVNKLPWALLNETRVDKKYRPTFPKYLQDLDGKKVTLTGFMQPFKDELDVVTFMFIEYPVGCWYCEMPELSGIILVETPKGKTATYTRGLVRVSGQLMLNYTDPEEFLYTIRDAQVGEVD